MPDIKNFLILAALFLILFIIAEILYRKGGMIVERTRKIVHIGTGLLTLLFPLMLSSHWEVFILCLSFAVLLLISQYTGLLPSVNEIKRLSYGSLAFPLAVWICFLIYSYMKEKTNLAFDARLFFYLPILIMAIADPVAALVGRRYPVRKYKVYNGTKSLMGSVTFFLVAFIISLLVFYYFTPQISGHLIFISIMLALATTIAEGITPLGLDNLTIPLVALLILHYAF